LSCRSSAVRKAGLPRRLGYFRIGADDGLWNEQHSKTIDVPACFIGGAREWGVYQSPGAFQAMGKACTRLQGKHLVPDAGHSVVEAKSGPDNQLLIGHSCSPAWPGRSAVRRAYPMVTRIADDEKIAQVSCQAGRET
jgi:hypothetical protein